MLSTPAQYSILLIERAVVGLLRICLILAQKVRIASIPTCSLELEPDNGAQPSLRDQIYVSFDLLAGLPPQTAGAVAEQIAAGLALVLSKYAGIIRSQTEWNIVFALMKSTIHHTEASRQTFELVETLVSDGPDSRVTMDNFPGLVTVLDEYATVASLATEAQQQGRRTQALNASK